MTSLLWLQMWRRLNHLQILQSVVVNQTAQSRFLSGFTHRGVNPPPPNYLLELTQWLSLLSPGTLLQKWPLCHAGICCRLQSMLGLHGPHEWVSSGGDITGHCWHPDLHPQRSLLDAATVQHKVSFQCGLDSTLFCWSETGRNVLGLARHGAIGSVEGHFWSSGELP